MRNRFPGYLYTKASWRYPFEFVELGYRKSVLHLGLNAARRSTTYRGITYLARDVTEDDLQQAVRHICGSKDAKVSSRLVDVVLPLQFYAEVHNTVMRALVAIAYPRTSIADEPVNVPPGPRGIQKAEQSALVRYIRKNPRLFAGELERCRLADELRAELGE